MPEEFRIPLGPKPRWPVLLPLIPAAAFAVLAHQRGGALGWPWLALFAALSLPGLGGALVTLTAVLGSAVDNEGRVNPAYKWIVLLPAVAAAAALVWLIETRLGAAWPRGVRGLLDYYAVLTCLVGRMCL